MKLRFWVSVLAALAWASAAAAQGAADRASMQTDLTRAKAEGRFGRLEGTEQQETVVKRQVVTVPVPAKRSARPAASSLLANQQDLPPKTKRVVIERVETIKKPAPLKINPF